MLLLSIFLTSPLYIEIEWPLLDAHETLYRPPVDDLPSTQAIQNVY